MNDLFNKAANIADCTASDVRIITELWIWKDAEGRWYGL